MSQIDAKFYGNTITTIPVPSSVIYYHNGLFNSEFLPEGFDIVNNKEYIEFVDPENKYASACFGRYVVFSKDYDISYFDYPEGSLSGGTCFNLKISNKNEWYRTQKGVDINDYSLQIRHYKNYQDYWTTYPTAAFTGLVIPISNFADFINNKTHSKRAIYVRYKFSNIEYAYRYNYVALECGIGHQISSTKIAEDYTTCSPVFSKVSDFNEGKWNTCRVWNPNNVNLNENYNYFLRLGLVTYPRLLENSSDAFGITVQINKIWSDDYEE